MYVATKGGEAAIRAAHRLLASQGAPRTGTDYISVAQIIDQQWFAVSRVMTEGSLYDPELAALAIAQAQGDLVEAAFLVRAFRTTLPRLAVTVPLDTTAIATSRRISASFKDVPGGQLLGPTFDYSHRLLDFERQSRPPGNRRVVPDALPEPGAVDAAIEEGPPADMARVLDILDREGLVEREPLDPSQELDHDLTRAPLAFPAPRALRLQALARGDEGFLLGLAYSTQRGYGSTHPFVGEIRLGTVEVEICPPELGFPISIGEIEITECEMINQYKGSATTPPQFTRGYGIGFGSCERKTMSMALVDRSLRSHELDEACDAPAQDVEFVLSHADNIEASGFVEHLKLPHYVDFQADLVMLRDLHDAWEKEHPQ